MICEEKTWDRKDHWEKVYSGNRLTEVSWYQQNPEPSLELIKTTDIKQQASIIDIGGGTSTLVDYLISAGYKNLSVLDISASAIKQAKSRLGNKGGVVQWIEMDITELKTIQSFDVWHDRAVFHFLTEEGDRNRYIDVMMKVLDIGAFVIIATFDENGPKKCSGLDVMHYSPEKLSAVLGASFQLWDSRTVNHLTPNGTEQSFIYCRFIRV